jgi:hypothetical protein
VVDASGVGSAVMDLIRRAEMGVRLIGVVITGNQASPSAAAGSGGRPAAGYQTVSRTELLTRLQVAVQDQRFRIDCARCRECDALRRELTVLRLEAGTAKSRASQDDLAFALALALWWG